MSNSSAHEHDATPEQLVQRAALFADLGRYDDAVVELGEALAGRPGFVPALTLLARVQLAAERPAEALTAAEDAIGASGEPPAELVGVRAMALVDLRRFDEAAAVAAGLLSRAPDDLSCMILGAAILAESRNGQAALDAAWRAVQQDPDAADAHLVLGLVAARLGQFTLAEQAYREAIERDPRLARAHEDIGVIRLEQRRYVVALADLADSAAVGGLASSRGAAPAGWAGGRPLDALRRLIYLAVGFDVIAPTLVGYMVVRSGDTARMLGAVLGGLGLVILFGAGARLSRASGREVAAALGADRLLRAAVVGAALGPVALLAYAATGTPWALAAGLAGGFLALAAVAAPRR
ncbi:tetratricopeptide repeat protein [Pilimelia columellifera]|uniref:Tetratricopeptide repeat protein n=1 Tax=Pilimelia columellifera subsp. columellifera TaxID=706583 RepID=A0ABN3NE52_9ACTN